jgi:hypothetical protein
MSAWIVNEGHIDAMVYLGLQPHPDISNYPLRWEKPDGTDGQLDCYSTDEVGRMLLAENIRSVRHRYPDDAEGELPGPVPNPTVEGYTYQPLRARRDGQMPTPVEGLKLLSCFGYQSCETPDWEKTEAFRFCEALRHRLVASLPGYRDAPWGWPD